MALSQMKHSNTEVNDLSSEKEKNKTMALKLAIYEDLILHQTEILQQNHVEIEDYLEIIKFQAQYNDVQSRKLTERSHELRTYYNAIQGLSEVTRLVMFSDIDHKFNELGQKVKEYDKLIHENNGVFDSVKFGWKLKEIEALESVI